MKSYARGFEPAATYLPGLLLCGAITLAALALQHIEASLAGRAWVEALVIAILAGTAIRTLWTPGERWLPGIHLSAKFLLEVAVVLLGASLSLGTIMAAGPALLLGIVATVAIALCASYGLGRLFGLPQRMAILIACGNSICGNSAIAAVAPVIGADSDDVAASIAFTAVLGVVLVLGLPFAIVPLGLTPHGFGLVAGLTVYAVPQVLAATAPIGSVAMQVGTLVKLVRVLMLGPVILILSLFAAKLRDQCDRPTSLTAAPARRARLPIHEVLPWFILGFLALALARSSGFLPAVVLPIAATGATWLTLLSMAALGLGVDLHAVAKAGPRVSLVVTLSLLLLGAIAFALSRALQF